MQKNLKELAWDNSQLFNAINVTSIVSITDLTGKILYVNDQFVNISGYSERELLGNQHNIVNSGYHPNSFWKSAWRQISAGNIWREEVCNRSKSGNLYWVDTFIYPCYDEKGRINEYFSIRNDITLRKQQELELQRQNKVLAEIAWVQSHEIRRPVASILGLVQLLQQIDLCDASEEIVGHLKIMAAELDEKIRKIIDLSTEEESLPVNGQ